MAEKKETIKVKGIEFKEVSYYKWRVDEDHIKTMINEKYHYYNRKVKRKTCSKCHQVIKE